MNSEYQYTLIVEVKAQTDKEEKKVLKKFKRELYNKYGSMDSEVMITGMKRE